MANELPWSERVNMLSINPEAASIGDIARIAAELSDCKIYIDNLEEFIDQLWPLVKDDYGLATENHERYLKSKAFRKEVLEVKK